VVASRVGGIPEVVDHESTGLLVDLDEGFVDGLAAAVNSLLRDTDRAAAMGRAGRERAVTTFGWSAIAEQTVAVYDGVRAAAAPR
jgi:alpha-maltose-1-phosphate synthase